MLKREEGFSLVEITLALSVSALLMVGVITGISTFREDNTYTSQTDAVKNRLETIRAESLSGVTDAGSGSSSSSIFGKIVEFDPASPTTMRVSTLISTGSESNTLSKCGEASINLGQMRYQGSERQAIVFRRQPDRVYAVAGPYTETASSCNPVAYAPEEPETGEDDPPVGGPVGPAPIPWQGPPPAPPAPRKPLYQLWNNVVSDHFYTTSVSERNGAISSGGYVDQGITGYLYETQQEGSLPLYRLYFGGNLTDHFYTTSILERNLAIAAGAANEGIEGYIMTYQEIGSTPFYRLYSYLYPDHFYTSELWQKTSAMASFRQYQDEGTEGYIFTQDEDDLSQALPQGTIEAKTALSSPLDVRQVASRLLGVKDAYAINENILDPLNYADGGPFTNELEFRFRLTDGSSPRVGIIRVNPGSGGVTREVQD